MATANNRVKFVYVASGTGPVTKDSDTVYFLAGAQALYLGSTLIADHQDLSAYALSSEIPEIVVSGSGECVTGASFAEGTLTLTLGDLSSTYVAQETGKGLSSNDFTDALKTKLEGIETGAEVNQNAFAKVKVGNTEVEADAKQDVVEFVAGSNVTITADASNDQITIAATDTTYEAVIAGGTAGLMSGADKTKLDGIASGAEVNVQSDWNQSDNTADDFIKNKPTNVSAFTNDAGYLTAVDEYTVVKLGSGDTGYSSDYAAQYSLKKADTLVGQVINIPKDMVISSGEVKTVATADVPYSGAQVGDKYIELTLANATSDKIYIPVKDLVDVYTAGTGLNLSNNEFSVDTTTIATRSYAESQALVWEVPA